MTPGPTSDPMSKTAADFDESPLVKITRLERSLADERRFATKATKQLHRALARDLRAAEQRAQEAEARARAAEKRATKAQQATAEARRRARQAEADLETIRESSTWKAGRLVVAVPARIKRWGRT